jgi:hypothetical protein
MSRKGWLGNVALRCRAGHFFPLKVSKHQKAIADPQDHPILLKQYVRASVEKVLFYRF